MANNLENCFLFSFLFFKSVAYGMDSRPPMAIFELLDYIVNEVSPAWFFDLGMYLLLLKKKKKKTYTPHSLGNF